MLFIIGLSYVCLVVPFGCFVGAAIAEICATDKGPLFPLRILETGGGAASVGASIVASKSESLSWSMIFPTIMVGVAAWQSQYKFLFILLFVRAVHGVFRFFFSLSSQR